MQWLTTLVHRASPVPDPHAAADDQWKNEDERRQLEDVKQRLERAREKLFRVEMEARRGHRQ